MSVNHKSLKDNITSKDFTYRGGFYSLKKDLVNSSDCFSFKSYEALKDINDIKTNNYSNLFLNKKQRADNWLEYTNKKDKRTTMVSTLSFNTASAYSETNPGIFLYFNKNYEFWDIYLTTVEYILTKNRPEEFYFNYIFYIEYLDDIHCRISHNFGDMTFYLSVDENKNISFVKESTENASDSIFIYNIENNHLILYKHIATPVYVYKPVYDSDGQQVFDDEGNPVEEIDEEKSYVKNALASLRYKEIGDEYVLQFSENLEDDDDNIIYLNFEDFDFNLNVNASWIGYDRKGAISTINNQKSRFSLENQFMFHHQYNSDEDINFLPLKNNLSYKNDVVRGSNLVLSPMNAPDVDFRNYVSISSGINQETGADNITLNFTFTDQTFTIKDGEELSFYIPSTIENGGEEPLWPYKLININDTKFVKNGSFSSDVPYFADKIKCLQLTPFDEERVAEEMEILANELGEYLYCFDVDDPNVRYWLTATNVSVIKEVAEVAKETGIISNGAYLCTWLYKKDENSEPVWLDRYYYPDFITRANALLGKENFVESFDNVLDKDYHINDEEGFNNYEKWMVEKIKGDMRKSIFQNTYFDKRSDFVLQPARNYTYSRLSSKMVQNVLKSLDEKRVTQAKDKNNVLVDLSSKMKLDGQNFLKIPYNELSDTNALNFNFDIYLDAKKRMGIQLVGTDYKHGFNIQNRKDLAPFHYVADENAIYMVNNNFEIKRKFDINELYNDNVIRFILGDVFDDVVVFSPTYLYILAYDLALKARISYADIMGIDDVFVPSEDSVGYQNILNYPYINYEFIEYDNLIDTGKVECVHGEDVKFSKELPISPYSTNFITIDEVSDSGEIEIDNRITKILTTYNSLIYKGNIFIPYYNKILKIIFVPDVEKDAFEIDDLHNYPCKIRELEPSEYFLNYVPNNYDSTSVESFEEAVSDTTNGFIEIQNIIKNIFISEEGNIYGMNYDKIALSGDRDTIYGLYAKEAYLNSGGWWWMFNQSLSKMEANQATSKYAEFASTNSIDFVKFNEDNYMALVRNFHTREISNASEGNKRLDIYDKTKEIIYTYDLSMYDDCHSLDSYSFIDRHGEEHQVFLCITSYLGNYYQIQYHVQEKRMTVEQMPDGFPLKFNRCFSETTNSNSILRYADKNALYFNLFIPSSFIYDYVATIKWNLKTVQTGWYNVNVAISLDDAEFIVKINDIEHERISFADGEHSWFLPYVNSNASVFNSNIYIGKTPKRYGTTMGAILNYELDPYICKNSKIENASLIKKKLAYNEYQALRLENKKINPLTLTIPCGQRNAIDEIVRYFKYNATSSISNSVKINISGLRNIIDDNNLTIFKKELLTVLNDRKEATVKIKDIGFVD